MNEKKTRAMRKKPTQNIHHGPPGSAIGRPVEKAKDFNGTIKRLASYLKPQLPKLVIVLIFAVVSTYFTIRAPKITGEVVNDLTEGFVAKSTVSSVSKMQEKMIPQLNKMFTGLNKAEKEVIKSTNAKIKEQFETGISTKKKQAYEAAVQKADSFAQQKFTEAVTAQKNNAYAAAIKKADAMVGQKFTEEVAAQKTKAYAAAMKKADAMVEQKFNEAIKAEKNKAYAAAAQKADAAAKSGVDSSFKASNPDVTDLTAIPGYSEALAKAQGQAEAAAKKAVDSAFGSQQASMQSKLAAAKAKAESMAKKAVDAAFAKQQPLMQSKLAAAKLMAERIAKAKVDSAFAKQQPLMQSKLAAAKLMAERIAKAKVDAGLAKQESAISKKLADIQKKADDKIRANFVKGALKKQKKSVSEYNAAKQFISIPIVKNIKDNNKKADAIQKLYNLSKKFPASVSKIKSVSKTDFDKGVSYVRKYGGAIPFKAIAETLLFLLSIYGLSALFQFIMQFVMSGVAQKAVYGLRKAVDEKISRMPLRYFDSHPNGDTLSRMTNDIDTISSTLQQSLTQLITSALQIVGYIWMMLTISWVMTLIVLATLPLYIAVTIFIAKKSQKHFAAQQKHLGELSGHTEEMFTGHVIVKAFGHEPDSIETFKEINDDLYNAGWKAQFMSGVMMPLMNFISNIGYVMIAVVGGIFVTKSVLGLGDIVSFIQYGKSFSMPIIQTANIANIIQSTVACSERVFELLDEEEEIPETEDSVTIAQPQGNILFNHVDFCYNEDEPLMNDMNLDIKQGETIAIVGPTGAGKTTLVNLLMRFYEIRNGSIMFDGVDLRKLRRGELRKMFGMVLQDTWLFNGTIHDNIAYGRENATEEQIMAASKAAHADRFIRSLPDGYNTVLNEEASNISQGQKQLLTIARAILADPTVLILDEATSSVDTRTEIRIQKAMAKLMQGRTNFVIAHRLSTIRDAKMILVMNHGTIIEKGNHNELLEKGGFYADLYNSQFTGASIA